MNHSPARGLARAKERRAILREGRADAAAGMGVGLPSQRHPSQRHAAARSGPFVRMIRSDPETSERRAELLGQFSDRSFRRQDALETP